MLDVRRLRLLYELSRRGTIAAVARALHFSPSAVSQQLAQLETETGVQLLEHVGRGVRLTEAGATLARHTAGVLTRLEYAEAELASTIGEPAGTVRVAAFQSAILALIPDTVLALGAHPRLRVEVAQLEPERAVPALLAHDIDIMIGEEYPARPAVASPGLHREPLCRDPLRLTLPPGADLPMASLADHPWVMEPHGTASRAWATATCRSAGFEPDVRYQTDDLLIHVTLVRRGLAAAFLPDLIWYGRVPDLPTHTLPDQERVLFTLVRNGNAHRPAILAVRQILRGLVFADSIRFVTQAR